MPEISDRSAVRTWLANSFTSEPGTCSSSIAEHEQPGMSFSLSTCLISFFNFVVVPSKSELSTIHKSELQIRVLLYIYEIRKILPCLKYEILKVEMGVIIKLTDMDRMAEDFLFRRNRSRPLTQNDGRLPFRFSQGVFSHLVWRMPISRQRLIPSSFL